MTLVRIAELSKHVGGTVHLDAISCCLRPGSFTVLLGATRAGKTSLLRQIAGLDQPTSGSVRYEDASGHRIERTRDKVAMVVQEFVNYPSMTVFENIASPLRASRKVARKEIEARVQAAAARFQLEPLLERLPQELSGGQQQRTALARALIKEADVVLLDEPLANLDYKLRDELREDIRTTFQGSETSVVYASTDPTEALWFGGDTAVLHEGRLLQSGPAQAVYQAPADVRVAAAISDPRMNLWEATLHSSRQVSLWEEVSFPCPDHMADLEAGQWQLGLHPHHLRREGGGGADCSISGVVELAEVHGSETAVHLRHGSVAFIAQIEGVQSIQPGQRVELYFDPRQAHAFDTQGALCAAPACGGGGPWL